MRKSITWILALVAISSLSFGKWVYDSNFTEMAQAHGAVVDANGRIWVGYYAYSDTLFAGADTIPIKPIYIYEPDGSQASFSPIQILSWSDGRQDTMWNGCRGISLDNNGNILYSAYNDIWQINYQTGEPMGALYDFGGSITEAGVTSDGYMFVTRVVPGGDPIWVFDISLGLPSTPTIAGDWADGLVNTINDGTNTAISRSVLVSNDGKDVYHGKIYGGTHNNGVIHYHSDDGPEGVYTVSDILYRETIWGQILDWGLDSTIWVGSYWDVSEGDFTGYYALDPSAHYQIVNSIGTGQPFGVPVGGGIAGGDTIRAPRGVAFSADSTTAYVCDFDGGRVSKFIDDGTAPDPAPMQDAPTYSTWAYDSNFAEMSQPHGAVVDANGRIWVGYYAYSDTLFAGADTIPIKPIYIYEPDGSQASFSPIQILSWSDGRQDTMWNGCRGISLDNNGNILYSAYNDIWQINYQTGEPMGALYDFGGSITEAGVTSDGYMFVTRVVPGGDPIWVFDISLGLPSTPTIAGDWADGLVNTINDGTNTAISRSVTVSNDGKDVYHGKIYGGTHNNGVIHYHSDDGPEGVYTVSDILYRETIWGQILDWGPDSTLWVGSYWDVSEGDFTGYYALDPGANYQIVNSIGTGQPFGVAVGGGIAGGDTIRAPRGVAFSADEQTAYVCDFDGGRVSKFVYSTVSVDNPEAPMPLAFKLSQNYPNPFNPTTNISFDLYQQGHVKLTVYDILGREVAVLVNGELPVGNHIVTFNARGLSSGMYIYTLQTDNKITSKRMTLLK